MRYSGNKAEDVKIAYIGGGSRGWAWGLMSDLAGVDDISGSVFLYDIDYQAAKSNEIIGGKLGENSDCKSVWEYKAVKTLEEALCGADFVVISILPGTFDEMESDVHAPEKYGIYQSVGDTVGAGGLMRALRTIPMFEVIAKAVKENCPDAWVINYTNPMSVCVKALYDNFPEIKAFGCCHEVFSTQTLLGEALVDSGCIDSFERSDIKVNVLGVNHFTWLNEAKYKDIDIMPVYERFADKYYETGYYKPEDENWANKYFMCTQRVKFDLFRRFGLIAAAGDRHLAEFCPGDWYLKDPETVEKWGFGLTPVSWRKKDLKNRLERSARLLSGEEKMELNKTGEEGVNQVRALLGLCDLVTNVNLPNMGQIPNLPIGAVVETNAVFRADSVKPVFAGNIPDSIYPLVSRVCGEQQMTAAAAHERDLKKAFAAFTSDANVCIDTQSARKLFDEMTENTKVYLEDYFK